MAQLALGPRIAAWLRLAGNAPPEDLDSITTPYSNTAVRNQASFDDALTPLAALLQCRRDVLRVGDSMRRAESRAGLNAAQAQLSHVRTRFRKAMKDMNSFGWPQGRRLAAGDLPFGKVQWGGNGSPSGSSASDSDGDKIKDESDEADDEDSDEYDSSSDEDASECSDEMNDKLTNREGELTGQQFQRTQQMHVLYNIVTLYRLGRMIANVQQSTAEVLGKEAERRMSPNESRARCVAQLQQVASNARANWAREMQSELEAAEHYRVAMIQVLQDEIRR